MGILKTALGNPSMSLGTMDLGSLHYGRSMFKELNKDSYASTFPSIRAISNEYMTVRPFAINGKAERQENKAAVNALYHPNIEDSSVAFFEKVAVSTLVHRKTYLLVWRREGNKAEPGGEITPDNIAGYTFLEFPSVSRRNGRTFYNIGAQEFSDKEVIVLPGGVDPHNLSGGYSPSEASRRWATLDEYIGDFQSGFFENGAVPAGQFIVTARTVAEYNEAVDKLQERHRGAGKNGNVTYSHRPVDPETGKTMSAQVEWVPFAQSNKDIDFKNLFEQVEKRLNESFGVPAIIKGTDSAAKYDNAQVAERNFAKRAVFPLLLRNYTQITHELNRITNGLGYAITFDYKLPRVSDEEKVEQETANIRDDRFIKLKAEGYTTDSIQKYFDTGLITDLEIQTPDDDDDADVDDGGEVNSSPDPDKIDGITPLNKAEAAKRKNPKALLSDEDKVNYEQQLREPARKLMDKQVEDAVSALDSVSNEEATEEDKETFTEEMMVIISAILLYGGLQQWEEGRQLLLSAGIEAPTTQYELSQAAIDRYRSYLADIATSYSDDTAASIRAVLDRANESQWTKQQTQEALRNIMNTDEWRITRLSTSEINRSGSLSSVEAMVKIEEESEATLEKSMLPTGGNPCEFCRARANVWFPISAVMVEKGQELKGEDGGVMVNNWDNNFGHDIHANGQCVPQYRVVKS